jgi:hypothetical protein
LVGWLFNHFEKAVSFFGQVLSHPDDQDFISSFICLEAEVGGDMLDILFMDVDLFTFYLAKLGPLKNIQPGIGGKGFAPRGIIVSAQGFGPCQGEEKMQVGVDIFSGSVAGRA